MQKASIALFLALTLSCVSAYYTVDSNGWVKPPLKILENTDTNFTSAYNFYITGLGSGDITLVAYTDPVNSTSNESSATWTMYTKSIDLKALTSGSNTTYTFKADKHARLVHGYAICVEEEKDANNIPQIFLYQTKINGAVELPRVTVSANTNANYTPEVLGLSYNLKNVFVFFKANDATINCTSIAIGGSEIGKMFNLTTSANGSSMVGVANGDALPRYQVVAGWMENNAYTVALVDLSAATISNKVTLGKFDKNMLCSPYVTDKTYYGAWCTNTTDGNTTVFVYVNSKSTDLVPLFTVNGSGNSISEHFPYSGYLGFKHVNATVSNATILAYDIWDLDNNTQFKAKTTYLTYDPQTAYVEYYTLPGGGMYSLIYNCNASNWSQPSTDNVVGLLLGGSYLTSVFGFLLTIMAGLLLF